MNLDLEGDLEIMSISQIFMFRILKPPDKTRHQTLASLRSWAYPGLTLFLFLIIKEINMAINSYIAINLLAEL